VVATDTLIKIRVTWKAPNDPTGGAPDYYRHTMTANKTVTDAVTGPFPSKKQVNGLVDTVTIKLNLVNDSVTLTSSVWSVRRGLESTSPAVAQLFVKRGDRPPLPPDSLKVDTLIVGMVWGAKSGISQTGICCGPAGQGPWLDTIKFARIYSKNPGTPYVTTTDQVIPKYPALDTVFVQGFKNPLIKFSFSKPNIVALAVDSSTSVFRVLDSSNKGVYIIANYAGKFRDSLYVVTHGAGYCAPWPNCYFNPQPPEAPIPLNPFPPFTFPMVASMDTIVIAS
jgi:hypothetical protein